MYYLHIPVRPSYDDTDAEHFIRMLYGTGEEDFGEPIDREEPGIIDPAQW